MASAHPLRVFTTLGPDKLLPVEFAGTEALSQLFEFNLTFLAESATKVEFDKLIGQPVLVELDLLDRKIRQFHGLCSRLACGRRDATFTHYKMEIVPRVWLLTRRIQSRIFQHVTAPDILKAVFKGFEVKWDIQGTFFERDYCVQYRESDFDFASRLMEEEGIYYYFTHTDKGDTLVVANAPAGHADVPVAKKIIYDELRGGNRPEARIYDWEKSQELRSGKVTLWDHHFELAHQKLDAEKVVPDGVAVGKVQHKLKLAGNDALEIYDYPGGYSRRFDGIDPGGGDRPKDLQDIFKDSKRAAELRLQEEQAQALSINGVSNCGQLTGGHKFTLDRHFDADGDYVLTEVTHDAKLTANYRSGEGDSLSYQNHFSCLPLAIPFRPPRVTPRPTVKGTQTAVVVGPKGEEIYTDKYGRVKVQFHWDRQGKYDANSSCWVRVATVWAGKTWGVIHIPRIGQEVVVDFLEGDPDDPIIIGSVYNSDTLPPGNLPGDKMVSGARTNSTPGGGGFNGMVCNDTKGKEQVSVHSQYNMDTTVENDQTNTIHNNRTTTVDVDHTESVGSNQSVTVGSNRTLKVGADQSETIGANRTISVASNHTETIGSAMHITIGSTLTETVAINYAETVGAAMELTVGGAMLQTVGAAMALTVGGAMAQSIGGAFALSVGAVMKETVGGAKSSSIGGALKESVGAAHAETVGGAYSLKAASIMLEADDSITLKTGGATIVMKSGGEITIKGTDIAIEGSGKIGGKAGGDMVLKGSTIKQN